MPFAIPLVLLGAATTAPAVHEGTRATPIDAVEVSGGRDWVSAFTPGVFGTAIALSGPDRFYSGAGLELSPLTWAVDGRASGPGRGALVAAVAMLRSPGDPHVLGIFEGGAKLSFELAPKRDFAIPFWGFTFGSLAHHDLPGGGYFQGVLGLHVLFTRSALLDLQGGYHYPFREIDVMRGPRAQLSMRTALW
jgi:hypothetical protein